ncbi:MAG: hypothetical protein HQL31_12670, partial [Planctomycetes bacterium]|nr:hypothetical protein [Planctomycetota bacterium]
MRRNPKKNRALQIGALVGVLLNAALILTLPAFNLLSAARLQEPLLSRPMEFVRLSEPLPP